MNKVNILDCLGDYANNQLFVYREMKRINESKHFWNKIEKLATKRSGALLNKHEQTKSTDEVAHDSSKRAAPKMPNGGRPSRTIPTSYRHKRIFIRRNF